MRLINLLKASFSITKLYDRRQKFIICGLFFTLGKRNLLFLVGDSNYQANYFCFCFCGNFSKRGSFSILGRDCFENYCGIYAKRTISSNAFFVVWKDH